VAPVFARRPRDPVEVGNFWWATETDVDIDVRGRSSPTST